MPKIGKIQRISRTRALKNRREHLKLSEYATSIKSVSGRIAELLSWCADRYPGVFLTHTEITQTIFGLGKLPTKGQQVTAVRNAISRSRTVCRKKYDRDILVIPGYGARATSDSMDALANSIPVATAKYVRGGDALKNAADLIKNEELDRLLIGAPPDLIALADWFCTDLMKHIKSINRPSVVAALMPPPLRLDDDDDDDDEKK